MAEAIAEALAAEERCWVRGLLGWQHRLDEPRLTWGAWWRDEGWAWLLACEFLDWCLGTQEGTDIDDDEHTDEDSLWM